MSFSSSVFEDVLVGKEKGGGGGGDLAGGREAGCHGLIDLFFIRYLGDKRKVCLEEKFLGSVNRGNSKTQTILPGGFIGLFQESPSSVPTVTHCTIMDCD